MAIIVNISDPCRKDARTQGKERDLQNFADRIERSQSLSFFDDFPPPFLVGKKVCHRQGRLIASRHPQPSGHLVVCFRRLMIKADRDYTIFERNASGIIPQNIIPPVDELALTQFVEEKTAIEPPPEKLEASPGEMRFLVEAVESHPYEIFCCESHDWVLRMGEPRYRQWHSQVFKALEEPVILEWPADLTIIKSDGVTIVGRHIPRLKKFFLAAPVLEGDEAQIAQVQEEYGAILRAPLEDIREEDVLRASRRSYPIELICDRPLWLRVQEEPESNLALSPEESDVLKTVGQSGRGGFPLFINGRAGSGKSTILQYIFAEYLFFYLRGLASEDRKSLRPPVYFTYSTDLLNRAKDLVGKLIESNYRFLQRRRHTREATDPSPFGLGAFWEFHAYLLSLVGDSCIFPPTKRVTYSCFRRHWHERFSRVHNAWKDFGPILSWHIIRSYIKGHADGEPMTPEEYEEYPAKQKSVGLEAFKRVYENVWEGWYRDFCQKASYWDDQDLARHVLEAGLAKPQFPGIICDEAQDFTRLELELLYRLSLFPARKMEAHLLGMMPYAFAGDEFQTINPTGFRWEALKASYVEKFIKSVDPLERKAGRDLNYQPLTYNYRSTPKIIHLCNAVQALRAAFFDLPSVLPQAPWGVDRRGLSPMLFASEDPNVWTKLRDTDVRVIVPCEEGEEDAFVRADPWLRQLIRPGEDFPRNVLSVARAKGLEFPCVAVYGFGDAYGQGNFDGGRPSLPVGELLSQRPNLYAERERWLPLEFFINKLYVALSRAQRRLLIIDGDTGRQTLWHFFGDQGWQETVRKCLPPRKEWKDADFANITPGDVRAFTEEVVERPEVTAKSWETSGLDRQDPLFMRNAAAFYKDAGFEKKASECSGWAKRFEGSHLDAGRLFAKASCPHEALQDLWAAGPSGYGEIIALQQGHPEVASALEVKCAYLLNGGTIGDAQRLEVLRELLTHTRKEPCLVADEVWADVVKTLLAPIGDGSVKIGKTGAAAVYSVTKDLASAGMSIPKGTRGRLAVAAGDFAQAVGLFEADGLGEDQECMLARALTETFPSNIEALYRLGEFPRISESINPKSNLTTRQLELGALACFETKRYGLAVELTEKSGQLDLLKRGLEEIPDPMLIKRLAEMAIGIMIEKGAWHDALCLLKEGKVPGLKGEGAQRLKELNRAQPAWHLESFIESLARMSNYRALEEDKAQKGFADLLGRFLITGPRDAWHGIPLAQAGCALEKVGRWTVCLQFYDTLRLDPRMPEDERKFASERWAKCKARQAELLRKDSKERGEMLREAREAISIYGGSLDGLPDFPVLSFGQETPKMAVSMRGPDTWKLGSLVFQRFPGRINVTENETGKMAAIGRDAHQVSSVDVKFSAVDDGGFFCKEWNLTVEFRDGGEVYLRVDGQEPGRGAESYAVRW